MTLGRRKAGDEMRLAVTILRFTTFAAVLLFAASFSAHGQPASTVARLAVLLFRTPATDPYLAAFLAGLRDLGYAEGRTLTLQYRYAEGRPERVRDLAVQMAALKPDVIVVLGGNMVPFVKAATSTVPVVMLTSQEPCRGRDRRELRPARRQHHGRRLRFVGDRWQEAPVPERGCSVANACRGALEPRAPR